MIHLIGIGPGDPEFLTLKAVRLLANADVIYMPQSNADGRNVTKDIIAPHARPEAIRQVTISMRMPERGIDPTYTRVAKEMADLSAQGRAVVYVSLGDTLLYSTGQYVGRELASLGIDHEYVPGIPAFIAGASYAGVALASGKEGFLVQTMPDSLEALVALVNRAETVVLMKVNTRLPILLDYIRLHAPAEAVLLHRIGLDGERVYDLVATPQVPTDIGYLSTAIIRRA